MSRFVRASKYRHVFGQTGKREYSLENIKVSSSAWDTNLISCSANYISVNWNASGGGAFAILPLPSPFRGLPHSLPSKLPDVIPLARGHTAPVLDTDWNPFDDSVVASAGEDGKLLIWKVSEDDFIGWGGDKWVPRDFEPAARVDASPRKLGQVLFHPAASHVLATASGEHTVKLWDLNNTDDPRSVLQGHTDTIQSIAFNSTGTLLASTCRDRKIRLFDPRSGAEPVRVTDGHGGIKGARVTFMGDLNNMATTGFSKMSDRQVAIWETGGLGSVKMINIDQSSGVLMPFWSDNNILFLAGKGDGNIRYYEYESDNLFSLAEFGSSAPQRGMCFLPRRALSVSECEIMRAYKVSGTIIEPIAFVVPRRADSFQSDIFPPVPVADPAIGAGEFFSGKDFKVKKMSLEDGAVTASYATSNPVPTKTSSAPAPAPAQAQAPAPSVPKQDSMPPPTAVPTPPQERQSSYMAEQRSQSPVTMRESPPSSLQQNEPGPAALEEENSRLTSELREARTQIRNLELQVESLRANAKRAAQALLDSGGH